MVNGFNRRIYKARYSAMPANGDGRGLEISLPSALMDEGLITPGMECEVCYRDDFIFIIPEGRQVNLEKLSKALETAKV